MSSRQPDEDQKTEPEELTVQFNLRITEEDLKELKKWEATPRMRSVVARIALRLGLQAMDANKAMARERIKTGR